MAQQHLFVHPPPANGPRLAELAQRAAHCQRCPLWEHATQTVFGEGVPHARLMLVGEQPGDQEDRQGHPFVGPAGRVLDEALDAAKIDRRLVYVTNAVKHFKWEPRGKRRLHSKPNAAEVHACHPWLEAEARALRPKVILCLGATAALSVLGPHVRVTRDRGKTMESELAPVVLVTVHPSSILRIIEPSEREAAKKLFVADLARARRLLDV